MAQLVARFLHTETAWGFESLYGYASATRPLHQDSDKRPEIPWQTGR